MQQEEHIRTSWTREELAAKIMAGEGVSFGSRIITTLHDLPSQDDLDKRIVLNSSMTGKPELTSPLIQQMMIQQQTELALVNTRLQQAAQREAELRQQIADLQEKTAPTDESVEMGFGGDGKLDSQEANDETSETKTEAETGNGQVPQPVDLTSLTVEQLAGIIKTQNVQTVATTKEGMIAAIVKAGVPSIQTTEAQKAA